MIEVKKKTSPNYLISNNMQHVTYHWTPHKHLTDSWWSINVCSIKSSKIHVIQFCPRY